MTFLFSTALAPSLPKVSFTSVLDILLVAFLIYQFLLLVRGRRAAQVLAGIGVFLLVYFASIHLGLELLRTILAAVVPYTAFALIVLFQSEIRRALIRLGRRGWLGFRGRLMRLEFADEILLAVTRLAQLRIGALIVIEGETGLRTFVESGVRLDAHLSSELLLSIFQPGGVLHDGAVITQKSIVAAASCFLPLSMNPQVSRKLGTRHRAAIGVTEETDCLAVIVSEETGRISVAAGGDIEMDVSLRRLNERIALHFGGRASDVSLPEEPPGGAAVKSEEREWKGARGE